MRYILAFFVIIFSASCKSDMANAKTDLTKTELYGTWRLLSSTDEYINDHKIIILEDSTYYKFSMTNGGGLIQNGRLTKEDSLIDQRGYTYGLKKIDTNKIEIENHHSFFGDFTNTYEKTHYGDYKDNLREYLKIDSIRKKSLGWWKLTKSRLPIELVNYSGEVREFTMQIKNDGTANFYKENYLDSIINYGYRMRENGIDLRRGDVSGTGTKLFFESDTIMKMLMTGRSLDTLELAKIYKLN